MKAEIPPTVESMLARIVTDDFRRDALRCAIRAAIGWAYAEAASVMLAEMTKRGNLYLAEAEANIKAAGGGA